jgi:N-acetylmuramoyl-L-alanine amidase
VGFVVQGPGSGKSNSHAITTPSSTVSANPLDQLSSADIAVHVARMASLPESTAVVNQADTVNGQLAISSADDSVIAKPQIVATALKSRKDIRSYTAQAGDTLASIAAKFSVTSDSIKWSNGLTNAAIQPGKVLTIPPVNGIVYTVKPGDTPDKLAKDYNTTKESIIAFNDAEVSGLPVGQQIVIPDGTKAAPMYVATASYGGGTGFAWGGSAIYGYNGYEYGWCTWYVASKIAVPANWGNANTWARYAAASGWTVSSIPRPGAIAQTSAGSQGHVAIVEAVSADGTMMKYSDMNGLAGWGRVGYSDWVPIHGHFQNFIYR